MADQTLFKDSIGPALVAELARRVAAAHPPFDAAAFVARLAAELPPLELKQRIAAVAAALRDGLPPDYPAALAILVATLGPAPAEGPGMLDGMWLTWPIATFVERYGLGHPAESLAAMRAITQRGSCEFAVRPYIEAHYEQTLAALHAWARDESFHVRRLASEGSRPRLPWGPRLRRFVADPAPVLALLETLRADPSEYVRRSVANSLNDIAKDHPDLAVATLRRWLADPTPTTERLARHALRGLIKAGHHGALALVGATGGAEVELAALRISPGAPRIGAGAAIAGELRSAAARPQRLVIDYVMHFADARGGRGRRKVFKLRELELGPGETAALSWSHSFRQLSTRRHYPGPHRLELQVNGAVVGGLDFALVGAEETEPVRQA
jgi:3-methyladenine DNA glycosylase AlkC